MVDDVIEDQSGDTSAHSKENPTPRVTGEWGWKDGWFSEAGLLAATEDLSRHPVAP